MKKSIFWGFFQFSRAPPGESQKREILNGKIEGKFSKNFRKLWVFGGFFEKSIKIDKIDKNR